MNNKPTAILVFPGRIPSKKNSKRIVCMGKFPKVLPSAKHEEWKKMMFWNLKNWLDTELSGIEKITITIQFPDNRKADLTNKAESIMDFLVDGNIIQDDSWQVVPELILKNAGIDKNPKTLVEIVHSGNIKEYEDDENIDQDYKKSEEND